MPRGDSEARITQSVLDRLIDSDIEISADPAPTRSRSLRELKQAIRRDLEWLLNTRRGIFPLPPHSEQLENSIASYGLPDFSSASVKNPSDQSYILRTLETAIETFEPRLQGVAITLDTGGETERALRFRIDAQLQLDPAPEPVRFDTMLQLFSGEYEVMEEE
jgi:type VI secretion system protein ImpF